MEHETLPHYVRIALDIASRIASGELQEHQKFSGRSLLSSEYNASPETIRKSLRLLSDIKAVEVQEKRGVVVLSADNARRYLECVAFRQEQRALHAKIRELLEQYESAGKQLFSAVEQLLDERADPLPGGGDLPLHEVLVSPLSDKIGRSIASLRFWQTTGATVVAIRRSRTLLISPGPSAELYGGDTVIFAGDSECVKAVRRFLNGPAAAEKSAEPG